MRSRLTGKSLAIILGIVTMLVFILCTAGCVQQPLQKATPVTSPIETPTSGVKMMVTFTQADNNTTKQVATGSQFAVQLESNPTTGYDWNATVSTGLVITNTSYTQNANPRNMEGVGGNQMWIVKANTAGKQTFSAIYKQPWMPTTGNETSFVLYLDVA